MNALDILKARHVSRLCHITKFQSLTHIVSSVDGILASSSIRSDMKNVTDTARYDGELEHICCPTDGQAEILIKDTIPRDYFIGIAVGNEDIASRIYAMLKTFDVKQIPIYVAPDVLTPSWSKMIREGHRPSEKECVWPEEE